jgi:iron complex transport system ATP-binding protein
LTPILLEAEGLRVAVPGRVLVDLLNWNIRAGEFCALLGGNGSGKSLLLRTLAGLRAPDAGAVRLGGAPLETLARRDVAAKLGFLPQDPDAPPQGTLHESVLLGRFAHLGFWEGTGKDDEQRAAEALAHVDLGALSRRDLATLSGGEQRRAAIARLLVQSPSLYLLDEPTNHLDPGQQLAVLERLRTLTRGNAAVLASLHDPNLALRFATHVCLLNGSGSAEVLECASLDVASLERLYGIPFTEARIGAHRVVTAS